MGIWAKREQNQGADREGEARGWDSPSDSEAEAKDQNAASTLSTALVGQHTGMQPKPAPRAQSDSQKAANLSQSLIQRKFGGARAEAAAGDTHEAAGRGESSASSRGSPREGAQASAGERQAARTPTPEESGEPGFTWPPQPGPPTFTNSRIRVRRAAGGAGRLAALHSGDLVEVTLYLDSRSWRQLPMHDEVANAGPQFVQTSGGWVGADKYRFELRATNKPGEVKPKLILAFDGIDDAELEFSATVLLGREEFKERLDSAQAYADESYTRLARILLNNAIAYQKGWEVHTDGLKRAERKQRLDDSLVEQALLTLAAGALGGGVGFLLKAKLGQGLGGAVATDGRKDLSKLFAKQGLHCEPDVSALQAYPMDSQEWQNRAEADAKVEEEAVRHMITTWRKAIADRDPRLQMSFNPEQLFREKLTIGGVPILSIEPVDTEAAGREFAKEFWRKWLTNYAHEVDTYVNAEILPKYQAAYYVRENTEGVEAEIDALGENGKEWIQRYGGISEKAEMHKARRLNEERRTGVIRA